ncbi:hypothetical protein GIB67_038377, partial [Kingdonia uniflora]
PPSPFLPPEGPTLPSPLSPLPSVTTVLRCLVIGTSPAGNTMAKGVSVTTSNTSKSLPLSMGARPEILALNASISTFINLCLEA